MFTIKKKINYSGAWKFKIISVNQTAASNNDFLRNTIYKQLSTLYSIGISSISQSWFS